MHPKNHFLVSLLSICIFLLFSNFSCQKTKDFGLDTFYNELVGRYFELVTNPGGAGLKFSYNGKDLLYPNVNLKIGTYELEEVAVDRNAIDYNESADFSGKYILVTFDINDDSAGGLYYLFGGHYEGKLSKVYPDQRLITGKRYDLKNQATYICNFSAITQ